MLLLRLPMIQTGEFFGREVFDPDDAETFKINNESEVLEIGGSEVNG